MIDDTRDALPKVGTRFQKATRRLIQTAAFLASLGAVAACSVDAGDEDHTVISAPSMETQSEPAGAEDGDGVQQGSTTMALGGDEPTTDNNPGIIQTPPVKLRLFGRTNLLAMVGLGSSVGRYPGQREFWHALTGIKVAADLTLQAVPLSNETESSLDGWLGSLPSAFNCRRPVAPSEWARGIPVVPLGSTSFLLWTPHPDDANEVLALQLVVDTQGQLASTVWYRSSAPSADGLAFRANSWQRTMRFLVNPDGSPATDPNLIQSADWHYIAMPLPQ